ncbi:MAG TPA: glutathione transferase GstA [Usitatibacter sp.]|jgi:glutathione S-transferase|nr:glutathione transferase GstA [Usitatibacter sp.]
MKLYYSPGACSLAPHIVAEELGAKLDYVKVDGTAKKTQDGEDFWKINPKGYVPALGLDDGGVLTEGPVISQYLADQKPQAGLVPAAGTLERYRVQEMLGYINSEIHKTYSPLFGKDVDPKLREDRLAYLAKRYAVIEQKLDGRDYLFGDRFTIADAYLFVVTNWAHFVKFDLAPFPKLQAFQKRVAARPAVQAAMKAEGLLK